MALVGSDFHGDDDKLEEFLNYKPEIEHVIVGDVFDGRRGEKRSDDQIMRCFDLILHGNARHPDLVNFVWGNHEVGYMYMSPFKCSGMRLGEGIGSKIDRCKHRFGVALVRDGYLLTHAGVHPRLAKFEDVNEECDWLNQQWSEFLNFIPGPYSTEYRTTPLFNVGKERKGPNEFGGIFWLDWRREDVSAQYNQVFGHSTGEQIYVMNHQGKTIVCVDTVTNDCFNTQTGQIERYGFNK